MPWGTGTVVGKAYEDSMCGLMHTATFDPNMFKKAVENFRSGSTGNQDGNYGQGCWILLSKTRL